MQRYSINEVFHAPQGEGVQCGVPYTFVRFSGCNLQCSEDGEAGFDCDTDFSSGRAYDAAQLLHVAQGVAGCSTGRGRWVCFTGGEPALQLDHGLVDCFHENDWKIAIETNGTRALPDGIDWICVSPKTAAHTIRVVLANEVKYVIGAQQALPKSPVKADHYLVSPRFNAAGEIDRAALQWCLELIREDPRWRLSLQTHKLIGGR